MPYPRVPPNPDDDLAVRIVSEVTAPRSTVFEVIEDLELFSSLETNTTEVEYETEHRRGLGVKTRWTMRDPESGETWESHEEIVHYDPPHQYAYRGAAEGRDYSGVHTLTENADGTTRHEFNEVFHFDADPPTYEAAVAELIANAKREAERRHRDPG